MVRELFSKIEDYIHGSISREHFSTWFYGVSRNADKRFTGAVLELAYTVQGLMAEASSAGWSENDLKEELQDALDLINPRVFHFGNVIGNVNWAAPPHSSFGPLRV